MSNKVFISLFQKQLVTIN